VTGGCAPQRGSFEEEAGHMSDQQEKFDQLMARVRARSEGAVRELIERYGEHILHVIRRRLHPKLRSKYDSIDFMQAVWASFFALPPEKYSFDGPDDLFGFIADLARNKVVDAVRQRFRSMKYNVNRECPVAGPEDFEEDGGLVSPEPTPQEIAIAREEWERLLKAQPSHYQQILELLREGRSRKQIAANLGLHIKTVERMIRNLRAGATQ
jgi:RNA polymerase sigma-70 factor (ECF subfamily)